MGIGLIFRLWSRTDVQRRGCDLPPFVVPLRELSSQVEDVLVHRLQDGVWVPDGRHLVFGLLEILKS